MPFIKPHKATLLWSVGFASLVALFWGVNLGLVLPVINVLAGEGSVSGYVDGEVAAAREEQAEWTRKLAQAEAESARLEAAAPGQSVRHRRRPPRRPPRPRIACTKRPAS